MTSPQKASLGIGLLFRDVIMASKAVPGRGITLPFVEGLHGTPFYFKLNPYVTLYSCVLIWGFIVYTISMRWDAYKEFQTWFQWVTDEWTWLYIASQNLWIGVLLYILCSKYAKIKLGGPNDEPEFSRVQWFAMLYCCGVAVGLFYYGVAEPMWHFHGGGRRPAAAAALERRRPGKRRNVVALRRLGRRALDGRGHERQREGEPRAHGHVLPLGLPRLGALRRHRRPHVHHVLVTRLEHGNRHSRAASRWASCARAITRRPCTSCIACCTRPRA